MAPWSVSVLFENYLVGIARKLLAASEMLPAPILKISVLPVLGRGALLQ